MQEIFDNIFLSLYFRFTLANDNYLETNQTNKSIANVTFN